MDQFRSADFQGKFQTGGVVSPALDYFIPATGAFARSVQGIGLKLSFHVPELFPNRRAFFQASSTTGCEARTN
jgi:hypothetical protein